LKVAGNRQLVESNFINIHETLPLAASAAIALQPVPFSVGSDANVRPEQLILMNFQQVARLPETGN